MLYNDCTLPPPPPPKKKIYAQDLFFCFNPYNKQLVNGENWTLK